MSFEWNEKKYMSRTSSQSKTPFLKYVFACFDKQSCLFSDVGEYIKTSQRFSITIQCASWCVQTIMGLLFNSSFLSSHRHLTMWRGIANLTHLLFSCQLYLMFICITFQIHLETRNIFQYAHDYVTTYLLLLYEAYTNGQSRISKKGI